MKKHKHVMDLENRIYDSTFLGSFLQCQMKCYYEWVLGIEPVEPRPPLVFGTIMHEALYYLNKDKDVEKGLKCFDQLPKFIADETRTKERGKLIFEGYVERWKNDEYNVRNLEVEFHLDMPGGSVFAGRIDKIVDLDDLVYSWDYKTTKSMGLSFFKQFRPNLQIDGYCYATRELVGSCAGCIIDGIQVAKTKQGFERDKSERTEREMNAFPINYQKIVEDVERALLKNRWIYNTKQCSMYGECIYKPLCLYGHNPLPCNFKYREVEPEVKE